MERHRTDVLSLVSGLLFVAIAAAGLTDQVELGAADVRWIAPGLLVLVGVLLVLPIGRTRSEPEPLERTEREEGAADDPTHAPAPGDGPTRGPDGPAADDSD